MNKARFWQLVFYISWSVIAIWLVLKVTDVIQTEFWPKNNLPLISGLLCILGFYKSITEKFTPTLKVTNA